MITNAPTRTGKRTKNIAAAATLFLAGLATIALAAYPMYVIRPFKEQDPGALNRALWVLLHGKPVLAGLFVLVAALSWIAWRRAGWVARVVLVPAICLSLLAAVSAWINPYEKMFHPLGAPQYVPIAQAGIDPNDMVIAVSVGGESRAYPIREMGYHHVVNDRLHQLPIVVTY